MKMKDYQDGARSTAIYPSEAKIAYPVLGLIGEIGELEAALVGDNDPEGKHILSEVGDALWYCANICCDLEAMLTDCLDLSMHAAFSVVDAQHRYVDDVIVDLGVTAEAAKKIIRDNAFKDKRDIILRQIGVVLKHLQSITEDYNSDLDSVAAANLAKLQSRQQRGVLKGDGDNR